MVDEGFAIVVKNNSATDTITAKISSGWNILGVGASRHAILPGQKFRQYGKSGEVFRVTIELPKGNTPIKLGRIKEASRFDLTHESGRWISDTTSNFQSHSEYQLQLVQARAEWKLADFFFQKRNFYEILEIKEYVATEEEIETAFNLRLEPYKSANKDNNNSTDIVTSLKASLDKFTSQNLTEKQKEEAFKELETLLEQSQFSDSTVVYIILLILAHGTLHDTEKKNRYDRETASFKNRCYWKYRLENFRALSRAWKVSMILLMGLGIAASSIAVFATCGGALAIGASVAAGIGLGGGLSSLLFGTSNDAYKMEPGKKNKGILWRLVLGGILGAVGGGLTGAFSPAITTIFTNLVGHYGAQAFNGFACTWIDGFLMSLANFVAKGMDDKKNWSVRNFGFKVILCPLLGALTGLLAGFVTHCIDAPLDEAIGAFIANKPDLHWLWASLLKMLGKVPGWIPGRVKHLSKLPDYIHDELTANKKLKRSTSNDSELKQLDRQQIQTLVEMFKKYETK